MIGLMSGEMTMKKISKRAELKSAQTMLAYCQAKIAAGVDVEKFANFSANLEKKIQMFNQAAHK